MGRRFALVVVVLAGLALVLTRSRAREELAPQSGAAEPEERETAAAELVEPEVFASSGAEPGESAEPSAAGTAARSPLASEPAAKKRVTQRTRIRGQVVDAQTGDPLVAPFPLGLEFTDGSRAPLAADGSFELSTDRGKAIGARVVEEQCGTRFEHRLHRYSTEAADDGSWRLALDVGWMAELDVVAPIGAETTRLSVALIEEVAGETRSWDSPYFVCHLPALAVVREASFAPAPSHRRWLAVTANDAKVEDGAVRWEARVEIPVRNGVQPEPIRVELHEATFACGVVVDERGEPWSEAVVELRPLFEARPLAGDNGPWEETGEDGAFRFARLVPGEYRLQACGLFADGPSERLVIHSGDNDLGSRLLPRRGERGVVSGELVVVGHEGGDEHEPQALLVLRDRRTGAEDGGVVFDLNLLGKADGRSSFEFHDVPSGPYELELHGLDGRLYPTKPIEIEAPVEGLVIEARASELSPCRLALREAGSGDSLACRGLVVLDRGRWFRCFEDASLSSAPCIVIAEGHKPRRLDAPADLVRKDADGCRVEVSLEPGWGRVVLAFDISDVSPEQMHGLLGVPSLAGVRVLVDGRELARSDGTGLALVALDDEPARVELERPGYRVVSASFERGVQFVLMERE